MPEGSCKLCDVKTDLQLSHVLPAFVFRWMRETSGNGHLRSGETPNRRVQDGFKRYWLCTACEILFSRTETAFANQLFHPYFRGEFSRFVYGDWLMHFCVSVSWRVLNFYRDATGLQQYEVEGIRRIDSAEKSWKAFLLGKAPHPGLFEQHLLPFDAIESISTARDDLSPNLNRYLMRTVDMDLCRGARNIYVYAKLGRLVLLGFVHEDHREQWQGTKVHVRHGIIEPRKYTLPRAFFEYLNDRARKTAELLARISERQSEKIDQSFHSNLTKYIGSDECEAMQNDLRMFGDAAFTRARKSESYKS